MKQAPAPILTELTKLHLKADVNNFAILTQETNKPFHGNDITKFNSDSIPEFYHGLKNVYLIARDNLEEKRTRWFAFQSMQDLINSVVSAQ